MSRPGADAMGTHPGTMRLPPLAPLASFGTALGTAAKLYPECLFLWNGHPHPGAPELPLLKAAPTGLAMKRSSQGCLQ